MEYAVIALTALVAAGLAFFSGFGLGTLLLPAFVFFFPVEVAVAATAVVHLASNVFRVALVGRHADRGVLLRFGIPAVLAAIPGAWLLGRLTGLPVLAAYDIGSRSFEITPLKLVIGVLILSFALLDLLPRLKTLTFPEIFLPVGGILSGFFGGLSGHQGALRSSFLIKAGLDTSAFIGTVSVIAVGVDIARLAIYGAGYYAGTFADLGGDAWRAVLAAVGAAMLASIIGLRYMGKVTLDSLRVFVGVLLILVGLALASGLI